MTRALSNIAAESPHPYILMVECQLLTFSPSLKPSSPSSLWHLDDVSIRVLRWARRRNADSLEVSLQKKCSTSSMGRLLWAAILVSGCKEPGRLLRISDSIVFS